MAELGRPAVCPLIEKHGSRHSAPKIRQSAGKNIQINPHSVGAYFEFPVVAWARGVRLQKSFRHIAVPQLVAAPAAFGIFEKIEFAVAAFKSQVQGLRRPQDPDDGLSLFVRILSLPVGAEGDGLRPLPLAGGMHSVEPDLTCQAGGDDLGWNCGALRD